MKTSLLLPLLAGCLTGITSAQETLFQDDFRNGLAEGWSWVREHPGAWRTGSAGLEIRIEPGNMWGGANNARNVLVRPLPPVPPGGLVLSAEFKNQPTEQYEQIDLVWYYDDSHMVKIGQELVDGQLSVVMGREEMDRTRTLAIIPIKEAIVEVKFHVRGSQLEGYFRPHGAEDWKKAGACDLPAVEGKPHQISIQAYQGPSDRERWVQVNKFRVQRLVD